MTLEDLEILITTDENEALELKETTGQRVDVCQTLCAVMSLKGWI